MNVMKKNIFSISSLLSLVAFAALVTGCADHFDTSTPAGEKPAVVAEAEQLAQYETLVSYVDAEKFYLGNTLSFADLDEGTVAASLTLSNFNEVTIPNLFLHSEQVDNEGKVNVLLASSLAADVSEKGINIFSSPLCASSNINNGYLEALIAPETKYLPEVSGSDVIDFESDALGKTYPTQKATGDAGPATASVKVENDPAGESGHVVHVKGATQCFPAITIKFPDGRKLGDYTDLTLDFYAVNNFSYTSSVFLAMGGKNAVFKSPKDYGCTLKKWGRGKVSIPLAALAFSDEQMKQTEVTILVGPQGVNCEFYIDNITLAYKYIPTYEVEKTAEEKFLLIGGALDDYITTAMEAAPSIDTWAVADCPVTSAPNLIWKQNLGETYFGYAASLMRAQRPDAKLFVSEYLMDADVRATFLHLLTADAIGIDQINGIDILMSIDAATFDIDGFKAMLSELKATGRLIRLTIQSVTGTDTQAATALGQAVAAYKQQVPVAQQYGITFGSVIESASNGGLWTTAYNRKVTYASCADALNK